MSANEDRLNTPSDMDTPSDLAAKPKPRRRSERRDAMMRTMIIDAATELLLGEANRAMTMEHIADRAELSTASLYKYFPDGKDELFDALVARVIETDEQFLAPAFNDLLPPDKELIAIGGAYLGFGLKNPGYFQVVAHPKLFGLSDDQAGAVAKRVSKLIDDVADVIKRGQDSPDLPEEQRFPDHDLDARKIAEFLHGAWNGLLGLSVRDDQLERKDKALIELATIATIVVRQGMLSVPRHDNTDLELRAALRVSSGNGGAEPAGAPAESPPDA